MKQGPLYEARQEEAASVCTVMRGVHYEHLYLSRVHYPTTR